MQASTGEIPSLKPIADDTPNYDVGNDSAGTGAFNLTRLNRLVSDCDNQPDWRPRADLAAAFVDGKQYSPEQDYARRLEGLDDVRPTNLVNRVVRSICGSEAKARTDIKVEADDDDIQDVCDVLNAAMSEAQRESFADMAVSDAYFGQVTTGLGWVEVSEESDPLEYPDRVTSVHRSEMWWDWKSTDIILRKDCRWQCRKRWADLDELEAQMPQFKDLLRNVSNGWEGFVFDDTMDESTRTSLDRCWSHERTWNAYRRRSDWYDSARKRVKLYEVWYRCPAIGVIMHLSNTRRLLYDQNNKMHQYAVASGKVKVTKQLTSQIRMSLFAGPHRMQDIATTRRNYPYVPFFAYRDDEDLTPYGLVEGMIGPQQEYNARRLRINWLLRARQLILDNDALDPAANSLAEVADQVMRPDQIVVLKADRTNKNATAFQIGNNLEMQKEQIEVMQDSKQLIQDVPGVYGSQLGQAASGVTSGIANSLLIEQGAVAMGDLNDNYRHSRRMVFELLLENQIRRRLNANLQEMVGRGTSRRVVVMNAFDPQTGRIINDVASANVRVGLGEVPSTPAFRMQQQQQIATIIGAMQAMPQAVQILAPTFIEATDLPNRQELADDLRRATGMPVAGDKQAQMAQQQEQQQQAQQDQQVKQMMIGLNMQKLQADIATTKSAGELNNAKSFQIGHTVGLGPEQPDPYIDPEAERQRLISEALASAHGAIAGGAAAPPDPGVPPAPVPNSNQARP